MTEQALPSPDARQAATLKLRCAEALLESTPEASVEIARLLADAWRLVLAEHPDAAAEPGAALSQLLPREPGRLRAKIAALLGTEAQTSTELELVAGALARLLATPPDKRSRLKALGACVLLAGVIGTTAVWGYRLDTEQVWRARFFPTDNLDGMAIKDTFRRLNFNWGRGAPRSDLPRDHFSARFDSCLVLDRQTNVVFAARAEDGVRLHVDERKLLNLWSGGKHQEGATRMTLEAGRHNVRVDYFNSNGPASLTVEASFDGGPLEVLDSRRLTLPADTSQGRCD